MRARLCTTTVYKKIYKGGLYSGRQNVWNERAYKKVQQLCKTQQIDIIHQVNPVEFRSIGKYGNIDGVPFVCGPVGGGEYIPCQLKKYIKNGFALETIRAIANAYYKLKYRMDGRITRCSILLFANKETRNYLIPNKERKNYPIMTELGSLERKNTIAGKKNMFTILSGGRLIYRKGFDLLYDAIERVPERYEFRVVSFFTRQSLCTIIAALGTNNSVVVSERNDPQITVSSKLENCIRSLLYASKKCKCIVFQTNGAKKYFNDKIQNKGVIILNPIKSDLPLHDPENQEKKIVAVGRLNKQKNYPLLLQSLTYMLCIRKT